MLDEVKALRAELHRLSFIVEGRTPLKPADAQVLSLIFGGISHGAVFATKDVLAELERLELLPQVQQLVGDGDLNRRLGKLFARCAGKEFNGRMVYRVSKESGVALWSLKVV